MIRRPPRSTQSRSSAASDVYKRQISSSLDGSTGASRFIESLNRNLPPSSTKIYAPNNPGPATASRADHAANQPGQLRNLKHGVFTKKPETLTNDFFDTLVDRGTVWKRAVTDGKYRARNRKKKAVKWPAPLFNLI